MITANCCSFSCNAYEKPPDILRKWLIQDFQTLELLQCDKLHCSEDSIQSSSTFEHLQLFAFYVPWVRSSAQFVLDVHQTVVRLGPFGCNDMAFKWHYVTNKLDPENKQRVLSLCDNTVNLHSSWEFRTLHSFHNFGKPAYRQQKKINLGMKLSCRSAWSWIIHEFGEWSSSVNINMHLRKKADYIKGGTFSSREIHCIPSRTSNSVLHHKKSICYP